MSASDDVYRELARLLDTIPNGYPATESGVEIDILRKLYKPEQAALALNLKLIPEFPEQIAERAGKDPQETAATLDAMSRRGLIRAKESQGRTAYSIVPFVVGIYEMQLEFLDEEFARLFDRYYEEAFHKLLGMSPPVERVVPVEKSISLDAEIAPYQRISDVIGDAKSWGVMECICRKEKQLLGKACEHPLEVCLIFSKRPDAFKESKIIRPLTQEGALEVLREATDAGLVHTVRNIQRGVFYVCNCCTCSCAILRGVTEYGFLSAVAPSDFQIGVDESSCTGCELCIDRCQFKALSVSDNVCRADLARCFGCGVCVSSCPDGALALHRRPASEAKAPPQSEYEWMVERASERGLDPADLDRLVGKMFERKSS